MDLGCVQPFYCSYLCRALLEAGAPVTLASIRYHLEPDLFPRQGLRNDPGLGDWVRRLGVRRSRWRRPLKAIEYCLNLAAWTLRLTARRPAVIHVQQLALADAGLPVDRWAIAWLHATGIPVVHTVHNLLPHDTLPGASAGRRRREFAKLYRNADALICHGEDAKRALEQEFNIAAERIFVIPHGLIFHEGAASDRAEDRRRWDLSGASCVFLFQGFVKAYKGLDWLLDSWRAALERGLKGAMLIVAGTGDEEVVAALGEHAARLGLGSSVRLLFRYFSAEEVNSLYRAADVAVFPYREITSSGAVMTAIGHGKAIIATDLQLFRDLLGAPPESALAAKGDCDALADLLIELARSPERRRQLNAASRRAAGKIADWSAIAAATLAAYPRR